MPHLRAAAVQFHHAPGDKAGNLAAVERMSRDAAGRGVELIAFPEMCVTGYWHVRKLDRAGVEALAEPVPGGPTCERLLSLSRELGMTIGAGIIERGEDGRLFNSYFVAMADGTWACHRKLHAFISEHISDGDSYTVFDTPHGWRVGVLICWDNNLVENARVTALSGAELLIAPHQTGGCNSRSPGGMKPIDPELWRRRREEPDAIRAECQGPKGRGWIMRWLPARAHDNGMFLVFANGVGIDDDEVRTGNAMILGPYGETLAESDSVEDDTVIADLDPAAREMCSGVRWMTARRPELYGPLVSGTGAERRTREVRFAEKMPKG